MTHNPGMTASGGRRALILGAGIQGCCAALALSRAGWSVVLVDRAVAPMWEASRRGEGKLHLGYVYANESDRSTARLMLDGALAFSDLIDGWMPRPVRWEALRSSPFAYGILPDSMVAPEQLADHYAWVDAQVSARTDAGQKYAGVSPFRDVTRCASPGDVGLGPGVATAFATSEVAVQPSRLREEIVAGLAAAGVTFIAGTTVRSVERRSEGLSVSCTDPEGVAVTHQADLVVNCLWHGRLAVDETMGITAGRPWLYRLKYAVHGRLPAAPSPAPSVTLALGPFGDVVFYPDGAVYLSWYPVCMTSSSDDLTIPAEWALPMAGEDPDGRRQEIVQGSLSVLSETVPALEQLTVDSVAAGVIVAWGRTDIDDPVSELHMRKDIGVHDHDGYISIDTGKLTMAPFFADQLLRLVER